MKAIRHITFSSLLIAGLILSGCSSTKKATTTPEAAQSADAVAKVVDENMGASFEAGGDSDSKKAGAIQSIYFPYDSSAITSDSRDILNTNADFMKANASVKIQIEGHCDERGGIQYHLALGERRAKAVRDYIVALGVSSSRLTTISFGKEKPIEFGHTEESWSKNRRANFSITAK